MGLNASCLGTLAWRPYVVATLGKARPPQRRSVQLEDFELDSLQPHRMAALSTGRKHFMSIDADRLAQQVKLSYEFIDALHGQALGLIKDVETQIGETAEALECLRPGASYLFTANRMSYSLATPRPVIANYYAVFFRHFPERQGRTTPVDEHTPPIAFVMVVLHEHGTWITRRFATACSPSMTRVPGRDDWPRTVEQTPTHVAKRRPDRRASMGRQGRAETGLPGQLSELPPNRGRSQTRRFAGLRGGGEQDSESIADNVSPGKLAWQTCIGNRSRLIAALGDEGEQLRWLVALLLQG